MMQPQRNGSVASGLRPLGILLLSTMFAWGCDISDSSESSEETGVARSELSNTEEVSRFGATPSHPMRVRRESWSPIGAVVSRSDSARDDKTLVDRAIVEVDVPTDVAPTNPSMLRSEPDPDPWNPSDPGPDPYGDF